MDKCPTCSAEIRPGDNFCLNCGHRLLPTASSPQLAPLDDATIPEQPWAAPAGTLPAPAPVSGGWYPASDQAPANPSSFSELPTLRADASALAAQPTVTNIENPAHLIIRGPNGNILQDYLLEKPNVVIGRVPESDIHFPGDLLVSRTHATIHYENSHYVLRDEGSANGTLVNNQPLARMANRTLQDGDEILIGDHQLTFKALAPAPISPDREKIEESETVIIPFDAPSETANKVDEEATAIAIDPLKTGTMNIKDLPLLFSPTPESEPKPSAQSNAAPPPVAEVAAQGGSTPVATPPPTRSGPPADAAEVTVGSFSSLSQPSLPNVDALLTASATLNEQIASLQQQVRATQEAMRNYNAEVAQTADRLRTAMRRLVERMDNTIGSVARSRDEIDWNGLQQALQDVITNPRDIGYATEFARRAPDVDKAFQRYQGVFTTLSECNSLLRRLIGEEKP